MLRRSPDGSWMNSTRSDTTLDAQLRPMPPTLQETPLQTPDGLQVSSRAAHSAHTRGHTPGPKPSVCTAGPGLCQDTNLSAGRLCTVGPDRWSRLTQRRWDEPQRRARKAQSGSEARASALKCMCPKGSLGPDPTVLEQDPATTVQCDYRGVQRRKRLVPRGVLLLGALPSSPQPRGRTLWPLTPERGPSHSWDQGQQAGTVPVLVQTGWGGRGPGRVGSFLRCLTRCPDGGRSAGLLARCRLSAA